MLSMRESHMDINHCIFPESLLYDAENFVWAKVNTSKVITIGITTILTSIAGKLSYIKLKKPGTEIIKGRSIGTIESVKYFGVIRSPISGRIVEVNDFVISEPKLVNDFPYTHGWITKIEGSNIRDDLNGLEEIENCHNRIRSLIRELHVRCFAAFPDHEMFEIGVECAATLTKLDQLLTEIQMGEVVHLVSDDSTADLEMIRWSEENGQSLLEMRREDNLYHFIVKKVK